MRLDDALGSLRALLGDTDPDARAISVPIPVAEAVLHLGADQRADDLINALAALDLVDCSPRMVQRRAVLLSRLRLDATDDEARAQISDLLGAASLRRRLHCGLVDALDRDDIIRAQKLRALLIDADAETLGWQADAEAALDGAPRSEHG